MTDFILYNLYTEISEGDCGQTLCVHKIGHLHHCEDIMGIQHNQLYWNINGMNRLITPTNWFITHNNGDV